MATSGLLTSLRQGVMGSSQLLAQLRFALKALRYGYVPGSAGWGSIISESFTGAWQRNIELSTDALLSHNALFRCITLISSDIAKMRMRLVKMDEDYIWTEVFNPAYTPVIRKPNHYQTRIQFVQNWVESKLVHGNTYVLKERDGRNVVTSLYVLNPLRVKVLVAPGGLVYYDLGEDVLASVDGAEGLRVPASEIIHDRYATINHPLVGVSPIRACSLAATQGLNIQDNSSKFFKNSSQPSGLLSAPGEITKEDASRIEDYWSKNFVGDNLGKIAVVGNGLKYQPMTITAVDAQLIDQLKWSSDMVASVFGVPAYMIGIGPMPPYTNIEALNAQYYSQCLQTHIENIEMLLDEGLELNMPYGTEFDLDDLLRMDTSTKMKVSAEGVKAGIFAPDEARFRFNLGPVPGGNMPYLQEQNWPLSHLSKRELPVRPPTPPAKVDNDDAISEPGGDSGASGTKQLDPALFDMAWRSAERFDRDAA